MATKQSKRRKLAKIRAELYQAPWYIDSRTLGAITDAVDSGDMESIKASLSMGGSDESTSRIVNGVAIIPITGVLRDAVDFMVRWGGASSYQLIEKEFNQAMDNESVKAVLFYCDSPGGSAIGCKRIADLVFESRGEKPIHAYVQGMCGSAAFYIASACDRIEAVADTMVASVGTIYTHQEYSKALDEFGITSRVFTNKDSPKKGHGNPYEKLTPEAIETLDAFVESYGQAFIADVARYKGTSVAEVIKNYGQGDAMRADIAVTKGVIDAVVGEFAESLEAISNQSGGGASSKANSTPVITGKTSVRSNTMNERIKAQLFALGLIDSLDAPDAECQVALRSYFHGRGQAAPSDEGQILTALQTVKAESEKSDEDEEEESADDTSNKTPQPAPNNVQQAHENEQAEARLTELRASRDLVNETVGYEAISLEMVLEACDQKLSPKDAMNSWKEKLAENEAPIPTGKVKLKGEGADRYAADIVDAMIYRAGGSNEISDGAKELVNRPLWAVAGECLKMAGQNVDMYGDKEAIAEMAMEMGSPHKRHTFFSENEGRQYIGASGTPHARPGDFPNILSNLANKYLDTIQLDDDYGYNQVSAVLPGGLSDFKPALMMNKGIVEELDELQDAEQFKDLGLSEEVLSYIFLRRFGNKWGWTPVLIANDDLGAFVEGMLGLDEAWQVTQNRLVIDRFTSNETLLDGNPLFANRADTGTGNNPAANNNISGTGGAPSDTTWAAMETSYADIGGINTGRRVRGTLNVCFCPTGAQAQAARRTFLPLNTGGLEMKVANTTDNVGLYRGEVQVITESELRVNSALQWFGLRNPTRLNTATVVRGYFNGYGTAGRRERWYDPSNKTTYVSLEGRIAVAVKNWRYAVRNAGQ